MMHCLRFPARTLLLAVLSGLAQAQPAAEIKVMERQTLNAGDLRAHYEPPAASTHELKLTLVYFSWGSWQRDEILKATGAMAGLLGQCSVRLAQVELVRVDAPQQYHYFHTPVSRQLARVLQPGKPTVYFVADTRQQPAFDAEAVGRGNSRTRPELADSVWVTRVTPELGIALAHELVHVLMDSGEHVAEKDNLMREDTAPGNTRLSAAQCARLRDVGARNGLLRTISE